MINGLSSKCIKLALNTFCCSFFCITKTTCYAGGSKKLSAVSKIKTSNDILMLGLATEHISKEASIDE
jgi:hypothetical protein